MLPKKLPKRLFKSKDVIHSYEHERSTKLGMKRMTRDHIDVLQNIEFTLVDAARHDPTIDDRMIAEVLRIGLNRGIVPDDADDRVLWMWERLEAMRSTREDVTDAQWTAGLNVVNQSVRRHSDLMPGETGYLDFVSEYVK